MRRVSRQRCQCQVCSADVAAAGEHGRSTGGFATLCRSSRCRTNPAGQRAASLRHPRASTSTATARQFPGKRRQPCDRIRDGRSRRFGPEHNSPRPRQRIGQYRREHRNDDGRPEIEECVGARRCRRTSANSAGGGRSRDNGRRRRRPRKCPARRSRASSKSERSDDATGFSTADLQALAAEVANALNQTGANGTTPVAGGKTAADQSGKIGDGSGKDPAPAIRPTAPGSGRCRSGATAGRSATSPRRHSRPPPTRRNRSRRRW